MLIEPDDLDLQELAAAANVSERTIRYYVQQGLLPSPGTRGPKTRYDRAVVDRIRLIKRLQRHHYPLAEIRSRLETLDDEGVRRALESPPERPLESSALGYVRELMGKRGTGDPAAAASATAPPNLFSPTLPYGGAEPGREQRATRSTWERIPLARDVELHVRRPLSREQNRRLERLIDAARKIFSEEP
jgi:DNA-binding transcriptional MerR regulator